MAQLTDVSKANPFSKNLFPLLLIPVYTDFPVIFKGLGSTYLTGTEVLRLGVWKRPGVPMLLSQSLSESGVEADSDDRDGRDIEIDLDERSRT